MSDVNDNAPKFELPDYQAHNVAEDLPIGTSILKVKAADADSGSNADIEYYVSDDHFTVSSKGIVSNAKRLVSYIIFFYILQIWPPLATNFLAPWAWEVI